MSHFYLAPWEWRSLPDGRRAWSAPGTNEYSSLDFRNKGQREQTGPGLSGSALIISVTPIAGLDISFGTDLRAHIRAADLREIERRLDLFPNAITETRLIDVVRELIWSHSDPSGITRWNTVRGTKRGARIYLGPDAGFAVNEPFNRSHPAWQKSIDAFRAAYRRRRNPDLPIDAFRIVALRKWTTSVMRDMGVVDYTELVPPEWIQDTPLKPDTSVSDNFNRPDESLDAGNWIEQRGDQDVVSNEVAWIATGSSYASYSTPLSSDAHTCTLDWTGGPAFRWYAPATRLSGLADRDFYYYQTDLNAADPDVSIIRSSGGAEVILASDNVDPGAALPITTKGEVDGGGNHEHFTPASTLRLTVTDDDHVGNLHIGIRPRSASVAERGDNFIGGDLVVPPEPVLVSDVLPKFGQVIFNSADEENRPGYGQRIARGTEE